MLDDFLRIVHFDNSVILKNDLQRKIDELKESEFKAKKAEIQAKD